MCLARIALDSIGMPNLLAHEMVVDFSEWELILRPLFLGTFKIALRKSEPSSEVRYLPCHVVPEESAGAGSICVASSIGRSKPHLLRTSRYVGTQGSSTTPRHGETIGIRGSDVSWCQQILRFCGLESPARRTDHDRRQMHSELPTCQTIDTCHTSNASSAQQKLCR